MSQDMQDSQGGLQGVAGLVMGVETGPVRTNMSESMSSRGDARFREEKQKILVRFDWPHEMRRVVS